VGDVDTIITGGSVFTAGWGAPRRAAVAVGGERIVAVGSDEAMAELAGPGTQRIDIAGRLLVPGFIDAHVHPVMAGVALLRCSLHEARSAADCLDIIGKYAAAHPDLPWIVGSGWSMAFFPGGTPTRQMLDAVVGDRPVFLSNRDGHGAWVNTEALRRAGLDESSPDPVDGRIEREPGGYPAGTLHEGAADIVERLVPPVAAEQQVSGLLLAQQVLFSKGITSWQDAAVGEVFGATDLLSTYLKAARAGHLKARVVAALWWDRARGIEQLPDLLDRRAEAGGAAGVGRLRATAVKIMQDGVAENFTAGMVEPYLDDTGCPTDNSGLSFVDPVALREYVTRLDAAGFQVHFHALGDRAVREALDAIEAARAANGPAGAVGNRHHLAHLQLVNPADILRFAALGASATIQPLWGAHEPQMDELTIPFLGPERAALQYPFGDLLRAGAHLAAGSDWSVSSPHPLEGIHVAVTRQSPEAADRSEPFYPHNALPLAQAMTAYTAGSAYVNHAESSLGEITAGRLADLVILDRDPFAGPPDEIGATQVWRTYVGGELVFDAAG